MAITCVVYFSDRKICVKDAAGSKLFEVFQDWLYRDADSKRDGWVDLISGEKLAVNFHRVERMVLRDEDEPEKPKKREK